MSDELNLQQQKFVEVYLATGNATEAAKQAGYSAKTAESQGSRLLKNAKVSEAIAAARKDVMEDLRLEATDVLREFVRVGMVDIGDLFDEDGALLPLRKMSPDARRAVASIEIEDATEKHSRIHKIKLWPKVEALDKLAKHLGLYERDNKQKGESFADIVLAAQRRREGKRG